MTDAPDDGRRAGSTHGAEENSQLTARVSPAGPRQPDRVERGGLENQAIVRRRGERAGVDHVLRTGRRPRADQRAVRRFGVGALITLLAVSWGFGAL